MTTIATELGNQVGATPSTTVYYKEGFRLTVDYTRGAILLKRPSGEEVKFSPRQAEVAGILIQNSRVFSHRALTKVLYGPDSTRETVKVFIWHIRKKLGPFCDCIKTIPKGGYRWVKPKAE